MSQASDRNNWMSVFTPSASPPYDPDADGQETHHCYQFAHAQEERRPTLDVTVIQHNDAVGLLWCTRQVVLKTRSTLSHRSESEEGFVQSNFPRSW